MMMGLVETLRASPPVREGTDSTPRRAELRWRPLVLEAAAIWLVTRISYAALTYYAILYTRGGQRLSPAISLHALISSWNQWDSYHYVAIATRGYYDVQPTAFFPLYPILIHLLILVIGASHAVVAALFVANLGTLGAFIGVALLAANESDTSDSAWRTLRVFIAYPLALFLAAAYTEGIFVAFVAGSLLAARRGSWRWAALFALLAGLTRPTGLALVLPLAWEYGRQHGWWHAAWETWRAGGWRKVVRPSVLAEATMVVGAVPAAIVAYMLFCWVRFGDPLIFLHAEQIYWGHTNVPPWQTLWLSFSHIRHTPLFSGREARLFMDFVPLATFMLLAFIGIPRLPVMFTLYTFGILYLSIATPRLEFDDVLISVGRYLIAAVPVFLLLGRWIERRPWLDALLITLGLLVQAVLTVTFLHSGLVY